MKEKVFGASGQGPGPTASWREWQPYLVMEQLAEPGEHSWQESASTQGPHEVGGPGALPMGTATENRAVAVPALPALPEPMDEQEGTADPGRAKSLPRQQAHLLRGCLGHVPVVYQPPALPALPQCSRT